MVQNQIVRLWITRLFISVLLMGFAVPSEAMQRPKRGRSEAPDAAAIAAAFIAAFQLAQNAGPVVLNQAMDRVAQAVPEGLRNLFAFAPVPNAMVNVQAPIPPAAAAAPRTPSQPTKPSKKRSKGSKCVETPRGSQMRTDPSTGHAVKASPGMVDAQWALYLACSDSIDLGGVERRDLQGRQLTDDEIIELFEYFVENLAATNALEGRFYSGRAKHPRERALYGHYNDMLYKDGQRKAEGFRVMNEEGEIPTFHHLFHNAHPEQLPFLEGIAHMAFQSTFRREGLNGMRGSPASIEFFNNKLKHRMKGAIERGEKRRKECEEESLRAFVLDDSCSETKGENGSEPDDDQDDSHNNGGFDGSPQEPVSCEN